MNTLIRSSIFSDWLNSLKNQKAKARILHRLSQASLGNFGDCEPVGEGVSESIHHANLRASGGKIPGPCYDSVSIEGGLVTIVTRLAARKELQLR